MRQSGNVTWPCHIRKCFKVHLSSRPHSWLRATSFHFFPLITLGMNFLKSSKIREWERQHKEHSKLCKQCQNLFSSLEALKALTSEQGLSISVKEIFGKTAPACSLCLGLRSNLFHDGFTVAPFDEGGWKGNFRLRAEFDKKALPTTNHPGYPSGILSVVYLSIYPASSQLQSSDAHFITIYRPLGILSSLR
jgi:hypothetical protein